MQASPIFVLSHRTSSLCRDCGLDESCVMCSQCFYATDHTNHNVSFYIAQQSGGCCDCGDPEAWKTPMDCPHHPPPIPKEDLTDLSQVTPKSSARTIIPEVPPVPNYPYRVNVPPELRDSMHRTIGYALDFLLDTLDYSPEEPTIPNNEADLRLQPSADPMLKDQYCVVLWNDEKHSFDEVIKLLCDLTNRSQEDAKELSQIIDETGRGIIEMNSNVTRLLEIAQVLNNIDLGVTVRRAYDTFREQMSEVIIEWLLDLSRCRLATDALVIREFITTELLSPRKREASLHTQSAAALKELTETTRLDYLLIYHTRLWKKPRLSIKELYGSILALGQAHKLGLGTSTQSVRRFTITNYPQRAALHAFTTASWIPTSSSTVKPKPPSNTSPSNYSPSPPSPRTWSRHTSSSIGSSSSSWPFSPTKSRTNTSFTHLPHQA